MNLRFTLLRSLAIIMCASITYAQTNATERFLIATPPAGVVKGVMKAGARCGVLIVGGRMVYSNDIFTVTTRGHKVAWQALEVTEKKLLFARKLPATANPHSTPPDCTPNYGDLVMVLEKEARSYTSASTHILRDQAVAKARETASNWCASNQLLCVKASLSDLTMADANTAELHVKNVDSGPFKAIQKPALTVHAPNKIKVPLSRDSALTYKAGNTVILCGRPVFRPGSDIPLIGNALTQPGTFTSFWMPSGSDKIGDLDLTDLTYDIFDPKAETIQ